MKLSIIFLIVCAFLLTNPSFATSDEISDLQKTIDELKGRVEELEESLEEIEEQPSTAQAIADELGKKVNIGGHLKFYLLDKSVGERNGFDQNNNLSAGIHDLYLYFSKILTDWLSIDVAPQVRVIAEHVGFMIVVVIEIDPAVITGLPVKKNMIAADITMLLPLVVKKLYCSYQLSINLQVTGQFMVKKLLMDFCLFDNNIVKTFAADEIEDPDNISCFVLN